MIENNMRSKISGKKVEELGNRIGYFKLNLPADFKSYQKGNGEGIWAVCMEEDKKTLDLDAYQGQFIAWAANDSFYYPEIYYGSEILAEFRGKKRPVAVWDDLQGTKNAAENRKRIMKRLKSTESKDDSE